MTTRRLLKRIHLVAMTWFMLCVGCVLATTLRRAGLDWWLVFPLSGYSAVTILLLVSLYVFALLHSTGGARHIEIEHPLTSSTGYLGFYVSAPLLGGLAALTGATGIHETDGLVFHVAMGTLGTTFLVWIVIDPAIGMIEMLLPASRRHRAERIAEINRVLS